MLNAKVLDYTVLVNPDSRSGKGESSFTAYCPVLQVYSEGSSVEEALKNIKEAIDVNLEVMAEDGKEIPTEQVNGRLVTSARVNVPLGARFAL
ncbi:MAG: type II toxin-antitoxin system HicB family antitoxin [Patescibacteria group bacterium]